MSEQPDPKAINAVAEAWASIDGKLEAYKRGESDPHMDYHDPKFTGHYLGYQAEAEEMIQRIRKRGFDIKPVTAALSE